MAIEAHLVIHNRTDYRYFTICEVSTGHNAGKHASHGCNERLARLEASTLDVRYTLILAALRLTETIFYNISRGTT